MSTGVINRIASGELKILGYEQDGAAIIENVSTIRPVSTWNKPTHSASEYGSSLLNHIMPDRKFPFPKSLYAVADTLKFFVSNKKDALILDFFAGSGTTAHAVNLLNKEDGGKRQSIMVTNNEVSVDESKSLKKKGFNPGDIEWEDLGIAHHITWPRIKCSILGIDTVGSPLTDTYKITRKKQVLVPRKIKKIDYVTPETLDTVTKRKNFVSNLNSKYSDLTQSLVKKDEPFIVSDEHSTTIIFDIEYLEEWLNEIEGKDHIQNFLIITNNNKEFNNIKDKVADLMGENQSIIEEELPMSKGFDTNAIFFKLGFLDKNSVAIGKQLSKLLPLLWMKAGSVGECPSIGENENVDALIYPKNKFGILIKENRFADFKNELDEYPEINTVFIVTDSDEGYVEMSSLLEVKQTFQLYKDYLDNFRINIRR
ncbi:DNA methyltransferase [Erysipelothrix rhusiopathiae]|uniref:DNA methyltransferase n=1 Tax=Erysipelothrix rhusiopathiae TaxID=1648 RepID=UPI0039EF4233